MSRTVFDINITNNAVIDGLLTTDDIDTTTATTLLIGKSTATKVEIADSTIITEIQGPITIDSSIDTISAGSLVLGTTNATSISIADVGVDTTIGGDTFIVGNLIVSGTTTSVDSTNVSYSDNHLYLNNGYTTVVAETGGLVVNYLPIATGAAVVATGFVAGIAATSNPTVETDNAVTFVADEFIQISGASDPTNNGLFEVLSYSNPTLTIRGIGTAATVEDFTQNQFVTDTTVAGTITRVNISVMRAGIDGLWETAAGTSNGLSFTDLTSGGVSRFGSTNDNRIARWNGNDTDSIQNSLVTIDDTTGTVDIETAGGVYQINNDTMVAYDATLDNMALGPTSMTLTTAGVTDNIAIGTNVLSGSLASGAVNNIGIGDGSLVANTTGARNIGLGVSGLSSNTTGSDNIAFGNQALDAVTTGIRNIGIGTDAIGAMTIFSDNVAVGYNAMLSGSGVGAAQSTRANTTAESTGIDGTYFIFPTTPEQQYYVWYDVNDSGTADPAPTAPAKITLTGIEVTTVTTGMSADQVATETRAAINGVLTGAATGATNQVIITSPIVGWLGDASFLPNTSGFNVLTTDGGQGAAQNIAVGSETLIDLTTGANNIAIGRWALASTTGGDFEGYDTIGIGYRAGVSATVPYGATVLGVYAAETATSLVQSVTIGYYAAQNANSITNGIVIGHGAAQNVTTIGPGIIIGNQAAQNASNTTSAIIIGGGAVDIASTLTSSVIIGGSAMDSSSSITTSVAVGHQVARTASLANSVVIGYSAANSSTSANESVVIGANALGSGVNTGSSLIAIGSGALEANTSGVSNVGVGRGVLIINTTGARNNAMGHLSLAANVSGDDNTAIGHNSLNDATVGELTAIGSFALDANTSGLRNTGVGFSALGAIITNSDSTALGHSALILATGGGNTGIGSGVLDLVVGGTNNTGIGADAGNTLTTGTNNTLVGHSADVDDVGAIERTAIGYLAVATEDRYVQLGQATDGADGQLKFRTQKISDETWISGGTTGAIINNTGNIERGSLITQTDTLQTTATGVQTISTIATATDTSYILNIKIIGRQSAVATNRAVYYIKVAYGNIAGTLTRIPSGGSDDKLTFEDAGASGWDVSTTLSGTNILVQVNPDTTNAVEWISYTEIIDINTA